MKLCKLDVNLTASPEVVDSLQSIDVELDSWLARKRKYKPDFIPILHTTLKIVVLNLGRLLSQCQGGSLILMGRPDWYQKNAVLLQGKLTFASVRVVSEFLVDEAYVSFQPGASSASKRYRVPNSVAPSAKFEALFESTRATVHHLWSDPSSNPIRLKAAPDKKDFKAPILFPPTPDTEFMAWKLGRINRSLRNHWPDIEITSEQLSDMETRMAADREKYGPFDLTKRTLYRVFNNGTFEDGGRFYGGWWQQIPSEFRRFITLDGKHTVEVDYSAIHPTMIYAELGLAIPEDHYALPIGHRDLVKSTFNALINARGPNIKRLEGYSAQKVGMPWEEFLKLVRSSYPQFEQYFGTGYGLKLQRKDSDIAEAVMLDFAGRGIPILPVHDSFIVHYGHESLLKRLMTKHFASITGISVGLKVQLFNTSNRPGGSLRETTKDVHELLNPSGPFAASERRLSDWFDRDLKVGRKSN